MTKERLVPSWIFENAPVDFARAIYLRGLRSWRSLLRAPSPGAKVFLFTSFCWAIPMAFTEPFKQIYLTRLGFNNLQLGWLNGLDMGLKVLGVLAGGWLGTRFGHRKVLVVGDLISWVISTLVLAFATEVWHVLVWAILMSSNSVVSASVQYIILDGTREERRASTFALFNVIGVLPGILLPFVASLLLKRYEFMETMRWLWGLQAASMLFGIMLRWRGLPGDAGQAFQGFELRSVLRDARLALEPIATHSHWKSILLIFALANLSGNLWRVYFSVFAVEAGNLNADSLGSFSQIGAISFAAGTLGIVSRLHARSHVSALQWAIGVGFAPPILIWFWRDTLGYLLMNLVGGACAAVHGAILGAFLANLLPKGKLAISYALIQAGLQIFIALAFPLAGFFYQLDFVYFPLSIVVLQGFQWLIAANIWKAK